MANNWAVAIGINQYQLFQPLGCAQADAEAVKNFLVTEGGFVPRQCLLLTDTSPPFGDRSTYPTKDNILLLLEDLAAACFKPHDRLWFFFSGYGVNYKGQDYLMPVEGDPNRIEETGIEVRAFMQSLQLTAVDVLLFFDINRAFGTRADAFVGKEIIELAKELQIPTILSCQPEQFSYESSELGHGFFTAALLEALRYGNGSSLSKLERYLSERTPELCQHYWRPTQNPVAIFFPSKEQVTLPLFEEKRDRKRSSNIALEEFAPVAVVAPVIEEDKEASGQEELPPSPLLWSPSPQSPQSPRASHTALYLPQLILWSATTMLVLCLIIIVVLRDRGGGFRLAEILPASSKTADTNDRKVVEPSQQTTTALEPISQTQTPQPIVQPSPQVTASPVIDSNKRKQALLDLEKMSLKPTQASDLRLAIINARKIQPSEPIYEQAQDNVQIWSTMILMLAENRAKQKSYADAIAAAQLITKDEPIYPKAQSQIKQWRLRAKQYVSNTTLIDAAVGLIRPGQASTYNRAIEVAKKVPPGQPGFDVAKKSIDTWSENILSLAQNRAARGEHKAAIATAVLVPEGTAAYKSAQDAIKKWQQNSQ